MADLGTEGLERGDRDLLNSLAFIGAEGRVLFPHEEPAGRRLETFGLCRLEMDGPAWFAWGQVVQRAALTPAGLRAARIGEGTGPVLVCCDGRAVTAPPALSHRPSGVEAGGDQQPAVIGCDIGRPGGDRSVATILRNGETISFSALCDPDDFSPVSLSPDIDPGDGAA